MHLAIAGLALCRRTLKPGWHTNTRQTHERHRSCNEEEDTFALTKLLASEDAHLQLQSVHRRATHLRHSSRSIPNTLLLLLSDDGVVVRIDKLRRLLEADEVALRHLFHRSGGDSELRQPVAPL